MGLRVTVVLDESNVVKLHGFQAKMLLGQQKSISFSYVLNRVVENGLKKFKA